MEVKEAIKEIEERIGIAKKHYAEEVPEYIKALEIAAMLLKKQIPRLPSAHDNGGCEDYESWMECSECSELIPEYTEEYEIECYCLGCGQKLKWEWEAE